jgi:transcriptional regulator GlxA family with amidase domain
LDFHLNGLPSRRPPFGTGKEDRADRHGRERDRDPLDVPALARAARLSTAHFSREFRRSFGETPHQNLLTRRLERAAALLRNTNRTVADICLTVGLGSVGSFTPSFGRTFGMSPESGGSECQKTPE